MELLQAENMLNRMKMLYARELGVLSKLQNDKTEAEDKVRDLVESKNIIGVKRVVLQQASKEARSNARDILQSLTTNSLKTIYTDRTISIALDEEKNPAEAEFVIHEENGAEYEPIDGDGGGVADVVAFSELFGLLQIAGKNNTAPMWLDEPTKYVSKGFSEDSARFIYELSHAYDRQMVMVTHDDTLIKSGDKGFYVDKRNGKSIVTEA